MTLSVFTIITEIQNLLILNNNIKQQKYDEWIIYLDESCNIEDIPVEIIEDSRNLFITKSVYNSHFNNNLGFIRRYLCNKCSGDILLELEEISTHEYNFDKIRGIFSKNSAVVLCYVKLLSDTEGDLFFLKNKPSFLMEISNGPFAFRKSAYINVDKYDSSLSGPDRYDLVCKLYLYGIFDYIYGNTLRPISSVIVDVNLLDIQKKYLKELILKEAHLEGGKILDVVCDFFSGNGMLELGNSLSAVSCNLDRSWPIENSSISVIKAYEVFHRINNISHVMAEIYRILKPGGYALIDVVSTDGRGGFQDPLSKSYWNQNTFLYYTCVEQASYINNTQMFFMPLKVETSFPNNWYSERGIPLVNAYLKKVINFS